MKAQSDSAEQDLVARARGGDDHAFAALCARYEARMKAWIRRRLSPAVRRKVSVSDVLQEATLVAHLRLGEFEDRGDGAFGRWLWRIVELKAREAIRHYVGTAKRAAGTEVTQGHVDPAVVGRGREASPSQMAMAGELQTAAKAALSRLPEHYRMTIHLIQGEGLTIAQAAERMGRSRDSVKGLYSRALAQVAAELGIGRQEDEGKEP